MRRSNAREMMDLPDNPPEVLQEDLRNLRVLNRYLGGYTGVKRGLGYFLGADKSRRFSLLDVGTGSGDIPEAVVNWARNAGTTPKIVALEAEDITIAVAASRTKHVSEISVVQGKAENPPFAPASFDFIVCSQLLHHFSEEKIVRLLRDWSKLARRAIIVSDLVRHPVAYYGIRTLTQLLTRNVMTLTDAPLSVERAFTIAEWRELFGRSGIGPFEIHSIFPFRLLALFSLGDRT